MSKFSIEIETRMFKLKENERRTSEKISMNFKQFPWRDFNKSWKDYISLYSKNNYVIAMM